MKTGRQANSITPTRRVSRADRGQQSGGRTLSGPAAGRRGAVGRASLCLRGYHLLVCFSIPAP